MLAQPSRVKFETIDDLVDHLALGATRQSDQIESARKTALTTARLAASCVVVNISSV